VVQCVIDLPKRMNVALQQGAFSVAVSNYCEARPLLKKYGHQGAFRSVASDCEKVIEDITRKLQERLQDPRQDAEECVRLLRRLGLSQYELQVSSQDAVARLACSRTSFSRPGRLRSRVR